MGAEAQPRLSITTSTITLGVIRFLLAQPPVPRHRADTPYMDAIIACSKGTTYIITVGSACIFIREAGRRLAITPLGIISSMTTGWLLRPLPSYLADRITSYITTLFIMMVGLASKLTTLRHKTAVFT